MLIRHVARHASQLSSSLQPLSVNHGCPFPARRCYAASAANVLRARRTQSILLDDDNPIVHPEKHKLHKAAPPSKKGDHDATLSEEELEWESDPYCEFRYVCKSSALIVLMCLHSKHAQLAYSEMYIQPKDTAKQSAHCVENCNLPTR